MSRVGHAESLAPQAPVDREDEEEGKDMGRHRRSAAGRAARNHPTGGISTRRSTTGTGAPQDSFTGEPWQDPFTGEAWQDSFTGEAWQDPFTGEASWQDSYAGGARQGSYAGVAWQDSYPGEIVPGEVLRREPAPRGIAPYLNPEAYTPATGLRPLDYADATARAHAYLFAAEGDGPDAPWGGDFTPAGHPSPGHRRRKKAARRPVRGGLLGVSVAVALGTAAVATGIVPGLQNYRLGGATHTTGGERVQTVDTPSNTAAEQGGTSGSADTPGSGTGLNSGGSTSPSPTASASESASTSASASASVSPTPSPSNTATGQPTPPATPAGQPEATPSRTPSKTPKAPKAPKTSAPPVAVSTASAAEAEVLKLVNEERAKVGCSPLAANSSLSELAESFSDDMATRDFFDHTDPDGKTPWDRAAAAGITDLGGENIARGQADAAAVMQAWMNSPGHRANILNCDFKTLGVGVHLGPGGPWWTQDFGY
ncbi:CAP domain-containing protein [Streptomyces sp. NPDC001307]|uniref:CAP domain-containing protein n=1 Tax=Streptomyces sp. NPDC001307 TaxID=3364560 RepID=UPI0036A655AE